MQRRSHSSALFGSWMGTLLILLVSAGCSGSSGNHVDSTELPAPFPREFSGPTETAILAGGCFWCVEAALEKLDGIVDVVSGYSGGTEEDPTYGEVSSGRTSHTEAVQVTFDPATLSYARLLDYFWRSMNPTDRGGQFVDRGTQYRPEVFVHSAEQRAVAEASKVELDKNGPFDKPIVTPITDASAFYPAEEYHQDYYRKSPEGYQRYHRGSGRERFLVEVWGENRFSDLMDADH